MDRRRWRVAAVLGGAGDSIATLLPLFALVALDQSVQVAASAGAAYTFGALIGNALFWGRLADRVRSPRALVIAGTGVQGAALLGLALFPDVASIVVLAAVLGLVSVSMDGALMRLVAGDLADRARTHAVLLFTRLIEVGVLAGFVLAAVALPLLNAAVSDETALRVTVGALGAAILAESALAASTVGRRRVAPALTSTVTDLARSGVFVLWSGAAGPMQRALRLPGAPGPAATRLSDSLRLLLVAVFVLFLGFALHSGVFAVYLRAEADLPDGAIMAVLLGGAFTTAVAMHRVSGWLRTLPAAPVQVAAGTVRAVIFAGYAALALEPGAAWSIAAVIALFFVSQTAWGALVPANTARVSALAPPARRGEVVAYFSAAAAGGAVVGATIAGTVADSVGFEVSFAAAAVVTGLASVLLGRW